VGAYFSNLIDFFGSQPGARYYFALLGVTVFFFIIETYRKKEMVGVHAIIRTILLAVLIAVLSLSFLAIMIYFLTRFPVFGFLIVIVIVISAVGIGHGIYTSFWQSSISRTWYLTSWEVFKEKPVKWKYQPTLTVEGKKYTYQTPQEYIHVLRRIKELGFYGPFESTIAALEKMAPYFDTSSEVTPPPAIDDSVLRENRAATSPPSTSFPDITVSRPPPVPQEGSSFTIPSQKVTAMQLKIRRSQRTGGLTGGKILFALDARVEPSAEDSELIRKYRLGGSVVYDSAARRHHSEALSEHAEATRGASTAGTMYRFARASISAAAAALSLRVTIDSLIGGVHIECKDLDELIDAESAIVDACKTVKTFLEIALTFDGREEVVEF
jgi:hypothetical protein